jgi:predicted RNA-binding Zn ribbon-like protein
MSLKLLEDFVNTYDVEEAVEHLATPAALVRWLGERNLAPARARADASDLEEAHAVREALRVLLLANNGVEVDVAAASATLNGAARRARLGVRFGGDGSAHAEPEAGGAAGGLGRILGAVADAMAKDEWRRLKACRAESCHWAFIDTARNQSRSWCSMEVCGNREKAKRFRERHAARA